MRFPDDGAAVRALALVFWWWLVPAARAEFTPNPYTAMGNVLRGVMADDLNWAPVLTMRVTLDESVPKENDVIAELLFDLGLTPSLIAKEPEETEEKPETEAEDKKPIVFEVLPLIKWLAMRHSLSGSEMKFGVRVLGDALSCRFASTMLLHTYLARVFSTRDYVNVPTVRSIVSKIQDVVARYADKVGVFGRPVSFFHEYSDKVNAVFATHDADAQLPVSAFIDLLDSLVQLSQLELHKNCSPDLDERTIAAMDGITHSDLLFEDFEYMDDHHLLTIVENMHKYDYVDFVSGGYEFWKQAFRVVRFRVKGNSSVEEEKEDTYME